MVSIQKELILAALGHGPAHAAVIVERLTIGARRLVCPAMVAEHCKDLARRGLLECVKVRGQNTWRNRHVYQLTGAGLGAVKRAQKVFLRVWTFDAAEPGSKEQSNG